MPIKATKRDLHIYAEALRLSHDATYGPLVTLLESIIDCPDNPCCIYMEDHTSRSRDMCTICHLPIEPHNRYLSYRHHSGECHRLYSRQKHAERQAKNPPPALGTKDIASKYCKMCKRDITSPNTRYKTAPSYCILCHRARNKIRNDKLKGTYQGETVEMTREVYEEKVRQRACQRASVALTEDQQWAVKRMREITGETKPDQTLLIKKREPDNV